MSFTDSDVQNFLKGEENPKSNNWQLKDCPQADFGYAPEKISSVCKAKSHYLQEFCKLKVKPIVCFVMIQCIFLPWTYHQCRINLTTKSRNQVAYFSYVTPVVIWSKNVTIPAFLYFVEWTWVFCFLKYWIVARFVVVS